MDTKGKSGLGATICTALFGHLAELNVVEFTYLQAIEKTNSRKRLMKFYFQFLTALHKFDYILRILLNGATCFFADSFYIQQQLRSL